MVCTTEPRVGGGRENKCFLKYLNLNSKFSILDNFRNDGSIFPTASRKKSIKKLKAKKLAGGHHMYPLPHHFVVKSEQIFEKTAFHTTTLNRKDVDDLNNTSVPRYGVQIIRWEVPREL